MERPGFDPNTYDLAIDYSVSGGAVGPSLVALPPSGQITFDARRGRQLGSFQVLFKLVPKKTSNGPM